MLDGLIRCGKEEGISGLWKGVTTNLILVSNPTVHYFICKFVLAFAASPPYFLLTELIVRQTIG